MKKDVKAPQVKLFKVRWGGAIGEQKNQIYLPTKILEKARLKPGMTLNLKIGSLNIPVVLSQLLSCSENSEPVMLTSPNIQALCSIPPNTPITIKYVYNTKTLFIGPLIGLFTVRNYAPDIQYGSQEPILIALSNCSPKLFGFVFVFCPEDVNWDNLSVTGYIPTAEDDFESIRWVPVNLPLPDVVYDRIPSRSLESRAEVQDIKQRLMSRPGIHYFNPQFLDKWETHLALKAVPKAAQFLPPTSLVEDGQEILHYLNQYKSIFLKPASGSLGRRIIKVKITQDNQYKYMYRSKDKQTIEGIAANFTALIQLLRPVMGNRRYIVQQDLKLAKYEGCPFDIRVLCQKDKWGNWRRTKIYVRQAAPGSFLSNLSDGAKTQPISKVLKEIFGIEFRDQKGLGEEIRNAAAIIPKALESATGMTWGELGLDLAVKKTGEIFLIEINSKPFRTLISKSGSSKVIERSLLRPLEFGKYLAGFYKHSPERIP